MGIRLVNYQPGGMMDDLIVVSSRKGIILTYKPLIVANEILIQGDRVTAYSKLGVLSRLSKEINANVIEVDGYVLPGFVDPHVHPESLGFEQEVGVFTGVKDRFELYREIKQRQPLIGDWVIARFDHLVYEDGKPPVRFELDEVVRDKPMLLIHRSGHFGVLNTAGLVKAIEYLGSTSGLDVSNGFIYEDKLWALRDGILLSLNDNDYGRILLRAQNHFLENGVLTIGVAGCSSRTYRVFRDMDERGELKLRTFIYLYLGSSTSMDEVVHYSLESILFARRVRVNGVKVLLDGALGPRTAFLSEPYSDDPGNRGVLLMGRDEFLRVVSEASRRNLQVAVHAIGDAALDTVLEVYYLFRESVVKLRHRIEHLSIVRDDQLELIERIKPTLVVQPHFVISDKWLLDRLGEGRIKFTYRFRTLYEKSTLAFSTDAPVEPVNPFRTIYASVTRGVDEGLKHGSLTLDERMNILDALHAYTKLAGFALRDDSVGCLNPGCYADFIVTDRNPLECRNPRELLDIQVVSTSVKLIEENK